MSTGVPERGLPPGQRSRGDHPRFGLPWYAHRGPRERPELAIEVIGPDGARTVLGEADLAGLEHRTQRSDLHCVTTWSRRDLQWRGVPAHSVHELVARRVDPTRAARFWVFHGDDGYSDETAVDDLLAPDVLFAVELDGHPLPVRHGAPVRLVAPAHYGYKNVKHLRRIELRRATRRRLPVSSHHPRGRVAHEERILGLPDRLVRTIYRWLVLPPTLWWYRRHPRP